MRKERRRRQPTKQKQAQLLIFRAKSFFTIAGRKTSKVKAKAGNFLSSLRKYERRLFVFKGGIVISETKNLPKRTIDPAEPVNSPCSVSHMC